MTYTLTNDKLIKDLLSNNQIVEAFPFLSRLNTVVPDPNCSQCQRKKQQAAFRLEAEKAKSLIAKAHPTHVALLKRLLGLSPGSVIRIYYLENNKTVPVLL